MDFRKPTETELSTAEAEALRDALLAHLHGSDYYARERLLPLTEGAVRVDGGSVRIGPWLLQSDRTGLFLRFRESRGPEAGKAHRADVRRDAQGWIVTGVHVERIRPQR